MAQFERDNIAKEIFVAAQNHLTMAESQGYLGLKENNDPSIPQDAFGYKDADNTNVRYLVVNGSGSFDGGTVLDQMLYFMPLWMRQSEQVAVISYSIKCDQLWF